ncbi:hypothetical protein [Actinacidiphila bryophytorum]|uniref:hypothetical protein n=1 Tax=Actinacidiphila bryophytorum TaxID=1436133 RepID=UPI001961D978|nr:hypothetical protein [Actinacidiphila bryophytorum]MBM9440159.1 hypothetical protein [Actinacidiphila bryophytorum]MBN6541819.1 hypothetical protein [Actinacidiphila bryophytorum]
MANAETSRRVNVAAIRSLSGNQLVATSTLTPAQTLTAGDCTQVGTSSPTLILTDGGFGDVKVDWHGVMSTSRSFTGDVRHARFDLKNSAGNIVRAIDGLDGPEMVFNRFMGYDFHRFTTMHMAPRDFLSIDEVDWWGDC